MEKGETKDDKNSKVMGTLVILYLKGILEKIRKTGSKYELRTSLQPQKIRENILCRSNHRQEKMETKNVVYSLSFECGLQYYRETCKL